MEEAAAAAASKSEKQVKYHFKDRFYFIQFNQMKLF